MWGKGEERKRDGERDREQERAREVGVGSFNRSFNCSRQFVFKLELKLLAIN